MGLGCSSRGEAGKERLWGWERRSEAIRGSIGGFWWRAEVTRARRQNWGRIRWAEVVGMRGLQGAQGVPRGGEVVEVGGERVAGSKNGTKVLIGIVLGWNE